MTQRSIPGLHHVTAISGPPQANLDFFTGTLGQRLVKKTVNFDAPDTYHLYYGNQTGDPGTILTFLPFVDAGPGRAGPGMASAYAYAVPAGQFDAWMARLAEDAIDFDGPVSRLGQRVITLRDPDGAPVELVETNRVSGAFDAFDAFDGALDGALDGFHSVTLWEHDPEPTARMLTDLLGYEAQGSETHDGGERLRFAAPGDARGTVVDILRSDAPSIGRPGAGTIHHVAFRAEDTDTHLAWRDALLSKGHAVTPVIDRQYFDAIYVREPGGVLFEIATDPPGFATDEPLETMGSQLMLPAQHEPQRDRIERVLPPLRSAT